MHIYAYIYIYTYIYIYMDDKIGWRSFVGPQRPSGIGSHCTETAMKKNGLSWRSASTSIEEKPKQHGESEAPSTSKA